MNDGQVTGKVKGIKTGSFKSGGEDVTKLSFFVTTPKIVKGEQKGMCDVEVVCNGQMADDWLEKLDEGMRVEVKYRAESREHGSNRYTELRPLSIEIVW